jgi:antitoxin VapB
MGVQLNIKDAETVRLARKLADASGRSVTETIKAALRKEDCSREAERAATLREMADISAQFRKHMPKEWHCKTSKQIMDAIYEQDELT